MATRLYSLSKGQQYFQVVEATGSAVVSGNVEVTIDLADYGNDEKNLVITALQEIIKYIKRDNWPPA